MRTHFGEQNVHYVEESRLWNVPVAHLLRRHPVIAGHFSVRYLSSQVLEDTFVFTFLRDPVERVLSQYFYYRSLPGDIVEPDVVLAHKCELKEILQNSVRQDRFSAWSNWQTAIFSGCDVYQPVTLEELVRAKHNLEQLAFVGTQGNLAACVNRLLAAWGRTEGRNGSVDLPKLNCAPDRASWDLIDAQTRALIKESNRLDDELYRHAKRLWRNKHRSTAKPQLKTDLKETAEYGSREIEIISVEIGDSAEKPYQIVSEGPWTLNLRLRSSIVEKNLTIGIRINDAIGFTLYGTNSFLQGREIAIGKGEFDIAIDFLQMALCPGRYAVTVALHTGLASEDSCYHWIENALEFEVSAPMEANYIGAVNLRAEFRNLSSRHGEHQ